MKRTIAAILCSAALFATPAAQAQQPIKIGEINSYKALPNLTGPYRKGWEMAQDEINTAGGLLGRKVETVFRDDNANTGDAVRVAGELVANERVDMLAGVTLSNVGLAVADYARQHKMFFLASGPLSDKIIWDGGNRYTYRLRSGTYAMAASVVPEAARMHRKRWALVYPNYEYGQAAVAAFKSAMKRVQPDVEFVTEQATPYNKLDPGPVVQAIADAHPDAIFNVLFGTDLARFVREGKVRGLFDGREVVSLMTGEPEYMAPLRDDAPDDWLVTGYPVQLISTPAHDAFRKAYLARYKEEPRLNSLVGYTTMQALAAGIRKAGSVESEKLVAAFRGLDVDTPVGPITFRPQDNQSTLGIFVGRTAVRDGQGTMKTATYINGAELAPPDTTIAQLRRD